MNYFPFYRMLLHDPRCPHASLQGRAAELSGIGKRNSVKTMWFSFTSQAVPYHIVVSTLSSSVKESDVIFIKISVRKTSFSPHTCLQTPMPDAWLAIRFNLKRPIWKSKPNSLSLASSESALYKKLKRHLPLAKNLHYM